MHPPLIGLIGKAGSGKSTVANLLFESHGYAILPFAHPLKSMLVTMGLTWDDVLEPHLKEKSHPLLSGQTPRQCMQSLGQWGRDIHVDHWVQMWERAVQKRRGLTLNARLVADDVRHQNEVVAVKRNRGVIIRIERPDAATTAFSEHISETELGSYPADFVLLNAGSIADLDRDLRVLFQLIGATREAAEAI